MNTKPKSNTVITSELVQTETGQQVIVFKVLGAGELRLELEKVSQANKERAMIHGFVQRVSDAAALPFDAKQNRRPTAEEKFAAMQEQVEHFNAGTGEWRRKKAMRVPKDSDMDLLLIEAFCRIYPNKERETLGKWVKARTPEERNALRAEPTMKAKIEEILAERTPKGIDVSSLLSELDAE